MMPAPSPGYCQAFSYQAIAYRKPVHCDQPKLAAILIDVPIAERPHFYPAAVQDLEQAKLRLLPSAYSEGAFQLADLRRVIVDHSHALALVVDRVAVDHAIRLVADTA